MLKYFIFKFKQVSIILSKINPNKTNVSQCIQQVETRTDILHAKLFDNCNKAFQNKPLIVSSFLQCNIKTMQDIWDENSKQFIDFNLLSQNTLVLRKVHQARY
jgi:hypothetical protein